MIKILENFQDYEVIATGNGQKLERWGNIHLLRPDPQIIWPSKFNLEEYPKLDAVYDRNSNGGGSWRFFKDLKSDFKISYKDLKFSLKLMGFKHTGLFPEQAINWDITRDLVKNSKREVKILNLFAYTGGATVALAKEGAKVCHVDSAKAMVERAKENCKLSEVPYENTRYIIDDCFKFVEKEIRRNNKYDAIIMDPPSYGRGLNGELWKLEDNIFNLVKKCKEILSDNPLFFLINSYTTGLQPTVISNILNLNLNFGSVEAYELTIKTKEKGVLLPCGCSGLCINK